VEHKAYKGFRHGQVNRDFELAGFLCQPCPEPAGCKRKMKSPNAAVAPVVKKTSEKWGRGKKSAYTKTHTFAQELTSAKPLGCGKKFSVKSSGLSIVEKASLVGNGAAGGKPKCAINLFGSNSSASDDDSASPRRLRNVPGSLVFRSKFRSLFQREVCVFRAIITKFSCVCLGVVVLPLPSDSDKVPEPQDILAEKTLIPSDEIIAREGGMINVSLAS
jgi:hypothetical protein